MNPPPSTDRTPFAAALARPPAERTAYLDKAGAGDPARRASLLHAHPGTGEFLESPADGVPVPKVIDVGIAKATHGRLTGSTSA